MALSIAIIIFFGLLANYLFTKLKLPGLLGMLIVGIILGPYCLNWLDPIIMTAAKDLRKIALIVILLRAGLGINKNELKKIGKTTFFISFLPGVFEGISVLIVSIWLLDLDFIRGGMLGFILAAVSPAVVVPLMLKFIDEKIGKKEIPLLILSAAAIDDVFAITFFSTFLGFYANKNFNIGIQLLNIPISIILGVLLGALIGFLFVWLCKKIYIRDVKKVILILALSIFMTSLESALEDYIMIASLLGVMTLGFIINEKYKDLSERLQNSFSKIWLFAEIFLFVLVGAEVNINVALNAGLKGLLVIIIGLLFRSIGVLFATIRSNLNKQEKLFAIISYLPKATVQAAIGSIPLAKGVENGDLILAVAVLAIIFTAPLGSLLINFLGPKLLNGKI